MSNRAYRLQVWFLSIQADAVPILVVRVVITITRLISSRLRLLPLIGAKQVFLVVLTHWKRFTTEVSRRKSIADIRIWSKDYNPRVFRRILSDAEPCSHVFNTFFVTSNSEVWQKGKQIA